jgi:predicted DNA-binding transcriptional regulator AlpA
MHWRLSEHVMEPRYLDPSAVVEYLSLPSRKALYGLVARKQIPYTRLGNRTLRFDRVDLELWLASRSTKVRSRHAYTDVGV